MNKNNRKPRIKLHKGMLVLYIACAVFILMALSLAIFRMMLNAELKERLDAIRAAGYPANLSELNDYYPTVPESENAAPLYEQAFYLYYDTNHKIFKPKKKNSEPFNSKENGTVVQKKIYELIIFAGIAPYPILGEHLNEVSSAANKHFLDVNSECIAMFKQAAKMPKCRFPIDLNEGCYADLAPVCNIRHLMRLLANETFIAAENGNKKLAVANILTMLKICHILDNIPDLSSYFINLSIKSLTLDIIEFTLSLTKLDSDSLKKINVEIQTLFDIKNIQIKRSIAAEQIVLLDLKPIIEGQFKEYGDYIRLRFTIARLCGVTTYYKLTVLDLYKDFLTIDPDNIHAIKHCELKNKKYREMIYFFYEFLSFGKYLTPRVWPAGLFYQNLKLITKIKMALIAIAIERYQLKYHKLPETLSLLIPEFMKIVPLDPFTNKPFRYVIGDIELSIGDDDKNSYHGSYKRKRGYFIKRPGWMIYSLGQNQKDDHGTNYDDISFKNVRGKE
jgi:hypothetical protein